MTLPREMRAVEITKPGAPDVLKIAHRPLPELGAGEVLIHVRAAGVNRPDCMQRAGAYAPPPGASDLPGLEVAGTVVQVGLGVTRWKEGDSVCALVSGGGYAEFCAAPEGQCLPIPGGLDFVEAASLPETFFTVWVNVFERAALSKGESLLVQGGSSGIGMTAIQLGRVFGHRVFATAGSNEKCKACAAAGAERAINYRSEDFVTVVKDLTGGKGVDVILDMVGGDYVPREIKCLANDGRIALIAFLGGSKTQLDMVEILMRRLTISGSTLRPRTIEFKSRVARVLEEKVWPLFASGAIQSKIFRTFLLEEASSAHALMESSAHVGKIVLKT